VVIQCAQYLPEAPTSVLRISESSASAPKRPARRPAVWHRFPGPVHTRREPIVQELAKSEMKLGPIEPSPVMLSYPGVTVRVFLRETQLPVASQ
jgi:hypothetical protein